MSDTDFITLTFVIRTPAGEEPGDDPRSLLSDDEIMFWGHEQGISPKALELGADPAMWDEEFEQPVKGEWIPVWTCPGCSMENISEDETSCPACETQNPSVTWSTPNAVYGNDKEQS